MLQFADVVKDYRRTRAVDGLSFTVNPGEIVGLLGPNGAGKTTAIRCAVGILRPTSGKVLIHGHNIVEEPFLAKQRVAFVPELPALYELLTVDEHLRFIAMCYDTLDIFEAEGDAILARYSLLDKKRELVATLSKGMRQKLAIACAFIHRADVLIFDEPVIGIDPAGAAQLKAEMNRARTEGATILVSTHQLDTAEKLCDRVVILARGKKVAEGTVAQLREHTRLADADLEEVFLQLTSEDLDASATVPP